MKPYKAIIYDIDGTLLDTLKMNMIPLQKIIKEELNEDWTYEEVLKFSAYPGIKVMEELQIKDKKDVYQRWVQYVNAYEDGATPYKGVVEVLNSFREMGIIQAVVSSKTKEQYIIDFVSRDLHTFMSSVVLAEDTKKHKPDPEPLYKCLEELQLNKEDVIYIGDALSDYLASKNAGIDFGFATWGAVSTKDITDPTYRFDSPADLLKLV